MMTTPHVINTEKWSMPMQTEELDDAVRALQDGVRGYMTAADEVSNSIFAANLRTLAKSRETVLDQLIGVAADETREISEADGGTITGALHRGWMRVKSVVAGDEAIVEAAKTGESEALNRLEKALESGLDPSIEEAIRRAMLDIESALKQLDGMTS